MKLLIFFLFLSTSCAAQSVLDQGACTYAEMKAKDSLSMKLTGHHTRYFQERAEIIAPFLHSMDSIKRVNPADMHDSASTAELYRMWWNTTGMPEKLAKLNKEFLGANGCPITGEPYSHKWAKGEFPKQ